MRITALQHRKNCKRLISIDEQWVLFYELQRQARIFGALSMRLRHLILHELPARGADNQQHLDAPDQT